MEGFFNLCVYQNCFKEVFKATVNYSLLCITVDLCQNLTHFNVTIFIATTDYISFI